MVSIGSYVVEHIETSILIAETEVFMIGCFDCRFIISFSMYANRSFYFHFDLSAEKDSKKTQNQPFQ